jgi:hypothetical protein
MPTIRSLQTKLSEAARSSGVVEALYIPSAGGSVVQPTGGADPDDWRFRKAGASPRELHPLIQSRMHSDSYRLYVTNPLARAVVELTVSYTLSGDVTLKARDPQVEEVLLAHWYDPVNNWEVLLPQVALELSIFGEQLLPVAVDGQGNVTLGYIDPDNIVEVLPAPWNQRVDYRAGYTPSPGKDPQYLTLVHVDVQDGSPTRGFRVGGAFYFAVNRVTGARRGISDIFHIADWLDGLDQFLFNRLERSAHMNSYIWDVTLEGASEARVQQYADTLARTPTKSGSFRVHNEKVRWSTVQPDLAGTDVSNEASLFKSHVLGGVTFPGAFFADLNLGRMGLSEAADPTYRRLARRQRYLRHIVRSVLDFQIDQKILHEQLPPTVDRSYTVFLPRISLRDLQRSGGAMFRVAQALDLALRHGWVTGEEASQTFKAMLDQLGVELLEGKAEESRSLGPSLRRRRTRAAAAG